MYGTSLYEAHLPAPIGDKINEYLSKQSKQKAFKEGSYRSCVVCKKKTYKRCTGCFLAWYCSKVCQESGWKDHRKECKETQSEYMSFKLTQHNYTTLVNWRGNSATCFNPSTKLSGKTHFTVKIQAGKDNMLVYNEEKTICGNITPDMQFYQELLDNIRERGVMGLKAYFYAKWSEGEGLKINVKKVQPPELW